MLYAILCCLPASQADLTRFRQVIVLWVSTTGLAVDKSLLTIPGRANYGHLTYYANRESVLCLVWAWEACDLTRLFSNLRAKQSRNKCSVAKALWTELCNEWTDMELQDLFFDSIEELSRQGYFQWIYSLRATGTSEISVRPCLSYRVCLLVVETHRTITRRNRVRSAWGAGKQQRIQHSNSISRFYSQNIRIIDFSSKTVAFPYITALLALSDNLVHDFSVC